MTIVQPSLEVNILTNKITSAPPLPDYRPEVNAAPLFRDILGGILHRIDGSDESSDSRKLSSSEISPFHPSLPDVMKTTLISKTVHALTMVGGHENPPARHIVDHEGVASVKEKLKTVSEELEDFLEVSGAVDFTEEEHEDGV